MVHHFENYENIDKDYLIQELIVHQRQLEMQTEELRRLNYELEALKNQYFELFNNAPISYVVINLNGIIKSCNESFKKLVGKEMYEIVGEPFSNFIEKEDKKHFIVNFRKFFQTKETKKMELKIIGGNKIHDVILTGRSSIDKTNVMLSITDISEIVERDRIVKTYLNIIEIAPVSIIITDRHNRIVYLNENYVKVSGYSREELLGKNPGSVKSGLTPHETYVELWKNLNEGKNWSGRFINRRKNGSLFIEEAHIGPIYDNDGAIMYYVAIKRDITKEIEREERSRRDEKIRFMYNLSSILAHNLNNINMPILVTAEFLKKELENTEYEKKLDIIINSVNKATKIINTLLKISQNIHLIKKPIKISQFIDKFIEKVKDQVPSNINIFTNIQGKDIIIAVDEELMHYALFQAIKNSIDSMPEGGNIYINSFTDETKKDYLVIEVQDQGIGIPDEIKPRIFEPFFTTKMAKNALGMGLAEIMGIVEKHGGFVSLDSKFNEGTRLKIYLPLEDVRK